MLQMKTGSRGIVCNVDKNDDPVSAAKANTILAQQQEEQVTEEQARQDAHDDAIAKRNEAKVRTTAAYATKQNTPSTRKAHQTAALAHTDAQKAYTALAGESSGNDLDTRAKAKQYADAHGEMAKKHKAIGEGGTFMGAGGRLNTGSSGVVCDAGDINV